MSNREETSGPTQDTLERLSLSAGLGTPRDPPGGAGGNSQGEGCLGFPAEAAAPATWTRIKRMKTSTSTYGKLKLVGDYSLCYSVNTNLYHVGSDILLCNT